jgi:hypothetical protein
MKYWKIMLLTGYLLAALPAQADLYLGISAEGGGDKLAETTIGDTVNAGGGIKFSIGSQNVLDDGTSALRFAAGFLYDRLDAIDGNAELSAITLDGMYLIINGAHSFGAGITLHMSPEYTQTGGGYADVDIKFDDAVGMVLEYQYTFSNNLGLGARYTDLSYEASNISLDASSFGVFFAIGF